MKIEDKNGNIIYQARPERREVLSAQTTYIMNNMLQDVMNRGTGYGVRRDYKFYHPAAGKPAPLMTIQMPGFLDLR